MNCSDPPKLKIVSKSKNFKRDSILGLFKTQSELLKFMIKVTNLIAKESENKMNKVKDLFDAYNYPQF